MIAREAVRAPSKDVIAKCYGGDITRKAQASGEAEGRKRMRQLGRVDLPKAVIAALKVDS